MKPDYALLLSFEGIAILHRAAADGAAKDGWHELGRVQPSDPDLTSALGAIRAEVFGADSDVAPGVKLVLPREQIRFLDIDAPEAGISVAEAVEAALDGTTPYSIDELIYDFQVKGTEIHIAAVARETLDEAEGFALDNGFRPLAFVSDVSPEAHFPREPFFGPTQVALTTLAPGVSVQGDDHPIVILKQAADGAHGAKAAALSTDAAQAKNESAGVSEPPSLKADAKPKDTAETPPPAEAVGSVEELGASPRKPAVSKSETPSKRATDGPAAASVGAKPGGPAGPARAQKASAPTTQPIADFEAALAALSPVATPTAKQLEKRKPITSAAKETENPAGKSGGTFDESVVEIVPKTPTDAAARISTAGKVADKTVVAAVASKAPDNGPGPGFSSIRAQRGTPGPGKEPGVKGPPRQTAADNLRHPVKPKDAAAEFRARARDSFSKRPKISAPLLPAEAPVAGEKGGMTSGFGFASRRSKSAKRSEKPAVDVDQPKFSQNKAASLALATHADLDESERMTVFGARGQKKIGGKPRFWA